MKNFWRDFIITNSDSESSDDEGFSDADSTSFGSRSESTDSSDDEVGITVNDKN